MSIQYIDEKESHSIISSGIENLYQLVKTRTGEVINAFESEIEKLLEINLIMDKINNQNKKNQELESYIKTDYEVYNSMNKAFYYFMNQVISTKTSCQEL